MIDIGISKLMIVAGIALVVIGPERLPRVARTVGTLLGRAQRYVSDVKAEVSRSIELEELQRARHEFESAARDVHGNLQNSVDSVNTELNTAISGAHSDSSSANAYDGSQSWHGSYDDPPRYEPPRKNWRLKRGALPHWYKQRQGVRMHVQSAAARVARHRPARRF
jgi:sec-independent protein translocase protein TatB